MPPAFISSPIGSSPRPWRSDSLADAFRLVSEPFEERELFPGRSLYFGGVHTVGCRDDGYLSGYGDPRRCGASRTVEDG